MRLRSRVLLTSATAAAALVCSAAPPSATGVSAAEEPVAVYVSTSGVPHTDIADVKSIRAGRGWNPGDPNSITASWRTALDTVMNQIAAEKPDAVFHTGDQVEGRWGIDVDRTGIFGPVGTEAQKKAAITAAGNAYYGEARRFWSAHGFQNGVNLFPAVGDHEIGDIGGAKVIPPDTFKYRATGTAKAVWARNYTASGTMYSSRPRGTQHEGTAYAVRLGDLLLVTVDPFWKWDNGIHPRIGGDQLDWLDRRITEARANGVKHVIVQSEIPALDPNRARGSSEMILEGGRSSAFWKTLVRQRVDILLAAEFHDMTTYSNNNTTPVQVVHGGTMRRAHANYLVIREYADRFELELKYIGGTVIDDTPLWQTDSARPPRSIRMSSTPQLVGTLTIDKSSSKPVLTNRTGFLREGIDAPPLDQL